MKNSIHSISCKNFFSFGDLTTLSFVVNDNAPENNSYFKTSSGTRLSKVETIIGPNASGKTNLLKILPFLKWIIVDSFNVNPQANIMVQPFLFGGKKDKPIELSVVFEIGTIGIYTYNFTLNQSRILSEDLKLSSMVNEKRSTKKIFNRTWNEVTKHYDFEGGNFNLPKGFENLLRSNASVIGSAMRLNHKESQDIGDFWQKIYTNVVATGWIGDSIINRGIEMAEVISFFDENADLKKEAEKFLSRFDLGLEGFKIDKQVMPNGIPSFNLRFSHLSGDQRELLPLTLESSGTKQLLVLLRHIRQSLKQGGVLVIDEFDVSLHPEMMLALFDQFIDPDENPNNTQLLFSTHSHQILNKLDKYQIVLTEKNDKGMTEAWRLDEVSGVRPDDNYYSKYIAGAYGAVPKI